MKGSEGDERSFVSEVAMEVKAGRVGMKQEMKGLMDQSGERVCVDVGGVHGLRYFVLSEGERGRKEEEGYVQGWVCCVQVELCVVSVFTLQVNVLQGQCVS
ncbi:hypothetical protein O6H91_12G086700 [Diphasiastrum complanatum]|uniref:Uncharacterized protein n=1 Tax=Diphasiastrum complanatum TaxID=34168 RepID=A0ACC2C4D3_DIPCM|nr:hypothetical protein O6H91_12G086700 [Diphasiastrum complanatum]